MKTSARTLFALFFLLMILSCSTSRKQEPIQGSTPIPPSYWPTTGWQTSSPEEQGFDSERLVALLQFINKSDMQIHSLLLIRNGQMVLDAYFYPFTPGGTVHDVASVTKSVTSALIGIAIDKGYIQSIDQQMLSFFPERPIANMDPRKRKITIKNLVTMTSGFDCGFLPGERELYAMLQSGDYVQSALSLPMAVEPGEKWAFCSSNMHLLSAIITRRTDLSSLDFARQLLFTPLGITEVSWPSDPQGITHGWGDLHLHPHDMAKIGYLYLNGGIWDGRQILSSQWIDNTIRPHTSLPNNEGYGYGWWLQTISSSDQLYSARGRGGQSIYVWPERKIIAVLTGGGYDLARIQQHLLSSIQSDKALPENRKAYEQLQNMVGVITRPPGPKPIPALPDMAKRISGIRYYLEKNMLGIKWLSLNFDDRKKAIVRISRTIAPSGETADFVLSIGLDDVYSVTPGAFLEQAMGAKGYWKNGNEFVLLLDFISDINRFTLTLDFEKNGVTILADEETGMPSEVIHGSAER